eukprot:CAMPEP_0198729282 /NCGR_PEP_ID=MMETSP1475-20131203/16664_1 /TAXON_ID= ORGANISM="Unidentified sp., Strain CCMP1999" /NCGR_SAMPLE_ID=MMETSP1475 /ASSEMBLY_ACC=CAM_ASM_001111 /LENGTH=30 /DNA_ID= /DNA_START= /DNA_END= /DNA_ORIENTATION=
MRPWSTFDDVHSFFRPATVSGRLGGVDPRA